MKRAVITGATGAIGTALIKKLISENVEILVLLRKGSPRNDRIPVNPLVTTDFCSLEELKDYHGDARQFDVFFHLAWAGSFGSQRNDMDLQCKNIEYELDAVRLAKRLGCTVFVGAGSQAEYGIVPNGVKLSEKLPEKPLNGYGIAKLTAGRMSQILCSQLGIRHEWGRVLSTYGPGDAQYTLVMYSIINFIKNGTADFTKGEQQWDYLYNADVANAFYLIAEKGVDAKIYNIGSGKTRSLKEYITVIRNNSNPAATMNFGAVEYADNQVMYLCADIDSLKTDTGFEPSTSFEDGIKETISWYKDVSKNG